MLASSLTVVATRTALLPFLLTAVHAGALTSALPARVAVASAEWYVDVNAPSCATGNGAASSPFCTINSALLVAANGDTIHIAPGTYFESLLLDKDLSFVGTDGRDVTIVDAPTGGVVVVQAGTTNVLDGLTITGGIADAGGGIFVGNHAQAATLVLRNSTVSGNFIFPNDYWAYGAGIYNGNGHITLENTTVSSNSAVAGFRSGARGGGIFSSGGSLTLRNSIVSDNSVDGYYYQESGSGIATNAGCVLTLENCTVAWNEARNAPASGVSASGAGTVRNTIAWGNRTWFIGVAAPGIAGSSLTVDFSDVQLGWSGAGSNNIDAVPAFNDAPNGDFSLAFVSPCIDAGDPATPAGGFDQAQNPRVLDGDRNRTMIIDMGAYEFSNLRLDVTGDLSPGGVITVNTTGWPDWNSILAVGVATNEIPVPPLGALFLQPIAQFSLGKIPNSRQFTIPPTISVPFDAVLQELGIGAPLPSGRAPGNFSNPVFLTIR